MNTRRCVRGPGSRRGGEGEYGRGEGDGEGVGGYFVEWAESRSEGGVGVGVFELWCVAGGLNSRSFSSGNFFSLLDPDSASREDKAGLVFGENYQRLREVKRVYDPDGVFNKWFPIPPA